MKRLATILALTLTTIGVSLVQPATAAAAVTVPVTGSGSAGTLTGALTLQKFIVRDGQVALVGTLTGTVRDAAGVVTSVIQNVTLPVAVGQATCDILHLDLGPLAIDLLGLQIDLSRVVLDITAQSGAGKLLGNLLCAVAGLLDNPGGLTRLLNDLLGALG